MSGDGFELARVTVRADTPAWSEPETAAAHRLMIVRSGAFRARTGRHTLLADPTLAYVGGPGDEQSIAHRPGAQDVCTAVLLSGPYAAGLRQGAIPVTGAAALAHRLLVAAARSAADPLELAERTARLVGALCVTESGRPAGPTGSPRAAEPRPAGPGRATRRAWRALADAARELLAQNPGDRLSLLDLARVLGCSPHHLSRVFHRETGTTLSRHRARVRALAALDALDAGAADLAGLAADLGFADHAHLTRTLRREFGHTPRSLRAALAG